MLDEYKAEISAFGGKIPADISDDPYDTQVAKLDDIWRKVRK